MKDYLYNAIILYLIIIIGMIFIRSNIFFSNGYELKKNNIVPLPNFVILIIITAFGSLYVAKKYK